MRSWLLLRTCLNTPLWPWSISSLNMQLNLIISRLGFTKTLPSHFPLSSFFEKIIRPSQSAICSLGGCNRKSFHRAKVVSTEPDPIAKISSHLIFGGEMIYQCFAYGRFLSEKWSSNDLKSYLVFCLLVLFIFIPRKRFSYLFFRNKTTYFLKCSWIA